MGQGLQKVARLCGGLIAKNKHVEIRYNKDGKIISKKPIRTTAPKKK